METKKQFKWFSIFEYQKEEEYLRKMHQSGWKLVKVTGLTVYHFEKCTPEDVMYQLDYNQEGLEHKEEYLQMFRDCGWEYLQDYAGYSYFRKPVSETDGEETIFCDDESRLQMMERVLKGRMLPLIIIFFCLIVPQLLYSICHHNGAFAVLWGALFVLYVVILGISGMGYFRFKHGVKK